MHDEDMEGIDDPVGVDRGVPAPKSAGSHVALDVAEALSLREE